MLAHWNGLVRFLEDGRLKVDINTVERHMRSLAMGRKSSLFAGSKHGVNRAGFAGGSNSSHECFGIKGS
jgi:hypothetical protein